MPIPLLPRLSPLGPQRMQNNPPTSCADATSHQVIILWPDQDESSVVYLKAGAKFEINNKDTKVRTIVINPAGLLEPASGLPGQTKFDILPGKELTFRASSPSQAIGGSLRDGNGPKSVVHDIIVCPKTP